MILPRQEAGGPALKRPEPRIYILYDFHMLMKAYDFPCGEAYAFLFYLPARGKKGKLL